MVYVPMENPYQLHSSMKVVALHFQCNTHWGLLKWLFIGFFEKAGVTFLKSRIFVRL
jgi:hypothetical protein